MVEWNGAIPKDDFHQGNGPGSFNDYRRNPTKLLFGCIPTEQDILCGFEDCLRFFVVECLEDVFEKLVNRIVHLAIQHWIYLT